MRGVSAGIAAGTLLIVSIPLMAVRQQAATPTATHTTAAQTTASHTAGVLTHGPSDCHAIAITFDLCPVKEGSGFDEPLVRFLIEHRIHATFFPSGSWISKHDVALRELLAQPFFEIGTHGETHALLTKLSAGAQLREILGPVETLNARYGAQTTLFRPPYGDYNDDTVRVAKSAGLTVVTWSVVSGDPDPRLVPSRIEEEVERRARNGSIIIFHANGRGWHTPEVIADVYQKLLVQRGFAARTISELQGPCRK
jgi:peptidoglycan/xylan/chitin deacetylase (PgdA/CDA1 family)